MKKIIVAARGSVLIMVLWALCLLTVFAIEISVMTQDKIAFLARSEHKNILRNAAKSGIYKACAIIKDEFWRNKTNNLLQRSVVLYRNPASFCGLSFGQAQTSVYYTNAGDQEKVCGLIDESSRLNLNTADRQSIRKLLVVLNLASDESADTLSESIFDWRQIGESEIKGFSSDDFYESLQFPYPQKKAKYETLDELKLVGGMSQEIYAKLINYVTIYGNEEININTVSWPVLVALGFSEQEAKMVENLRNGTDGKPATLDDILFQDRSSFIEKMKEALAMKPEDFERFRALVESIPFESSSKIFRIESHAAFNLRNENTSIVCVFNAADDKIVYWKER